MKEIKDVPSSVQIIKADNGYVIKHWQHVDYCEEEREDCGKEVTSVFETNSDGRIICNYVYGDDVYYTEQEKIKAFTRMIFFVADYFEVDIKDLFKIIAEEYKKQLEDNNKE